MRRGNEATLDQKIGAFLRAARRRAGLTTSQVANQIGLCSQMVKFYEAGRNQVPLSRLIVIARLLNVDPREVIGCVEPDRAGEPLMSQPEANLLKAARRLPASMVSGFTHFLNSFADGMAAASVDSKVLLRGFGPSPVELIQRGPIELSISEGIGLGEEAA
jgi:transcriptional regulator with XRE-family HTH domain